MTIAFTCFFYILILMICLLFAKRADKKDNIKLLIPIILILSLLAGLRHYTVGFDTKNYMISIESFFRIRRHIWPYTFFSKGYGYFVVFIYSIYHNYSFLLFIEALIINFLIVRRLWDFRKKSSFVFLMFIYLIVIYLRTFNLNVQYISIAIVFYASRYLDKDKKILYLLCLFLASMLHTSALIGIGYYFVKILKFEKITKKQLLIQMIAIIFGIGILFLISNNLYDRYEQYINNGHMNVGLMVFVQLSLYLISLFFYKKKMYSNIESKKVFKNISIYYMIGIILSFSSYFVANAGRISYYYMIYEPIFYGCLIKSEKVDKYYKLFIYLWFIFYSIYVIVNALEVTKYFPYNFYWTIVY